MSSDLFAEFTSSSISAAAPAPSQTGTSAPQPATTRFSFFDDLCSLDSAPSSSHHRESTGDATVTEYPKPVPSPQPVALSAVTPSVGENDEWGEFEDAAPLVFNPPPSVAERSSPWAFVQSLPYNPPAIVSANKLAHAPNTATSKSTSDPFNIRLGSDSLPSRHGPHPAPQPQAPRSPLNQPQIKHDPNILFDAGEPEEEDDFGDFEDPTYGEDARIRNRGNAERKQELQPSMLSSHSASSLPNPTNSSYSDVNIPPSVRPNTSATSNASKTTLFAFAQKQPQTSLVSTPSQDESWDNFTDWEASLPPSQAKNDSPGPSLLPTVPVQNPSSDLAQVASTELPPTNVPPPGVLLSLFPPLISEAQKRLFNPIAAQTYQMKNRLLSDPAIVSFLQSYLAISTVAARIIAGRKLRWKRDMHLAQGMKVGPASSRSTSGMKLAGIDKSEAVKEDREALDVVLAWREQLGRLRSAVAVASTIKPGCLRAIPEMQEVMPVRTLKESEGGVPAPQQCALCGLKREERVNKVDIAVEDSFGEWWIEQVSMHRTCRNFWQEHKNTLKHR